MDLSSVTSVLHNGLGVHHEKQVICSCYDRGTTIDVGRRADNAHGELDVPLAIGSDHYRREFWLATEASFYHWSGNGTASNPYIIDTTVDASGYRSAISINDTTAYVTIQDCSISDGAFGIYLRDASNVTIKHNDISTGYGVFMASSNNNTISNNVMSDMYEDGVHPG